MEIGMISRLSAAAIRRAGAGRQKDDDLIAGNLP
jgi:hypothetical protein